MDSILPGQVGTGMRTIVYVLRELWVWWDKTESWTVLIQRVGYAQGNCGCREVGTLRRGVL